MKGWQLSKIIRMWETHTVRQIADETGLTPLYVSDIAYRHRDLCPPKHEHRRVTEKEVEAMRGLREEGLTYKQIAERLGCTSRRVSYCLKERRA